MGGCSGSVVEELSQVLLEARSRGQINVKASTEINQPCATGC